MWHRKLGILATLEGRVNTTYILSERLLRMTEADLLLQQNNNTAINNKLNSITTQQQNSLSVQHKHNYKLTSSVIFVLIYFLVLVLVFQLFFTFNFVLVLQYFYVLVLVLPTTKEYQTCWQRRVDDLPNYCPPLVTDSTPYGRSTCKRRIVC